MVERRKRILQDGTQDAHHLFHLLPVVAQRGIHIKAVQGKLEMRLAFPIAHFRTDDELRFRYTPSIREARERIVYRSD